MPAIIQLQNFSALVNSYPANETNASASDPNPMVVSFYDTERDQEIFWRIVIAMAIRDHASSLHYHPWEGDSSLYYIVDWQKYGLVPPIGLDADKLLLAISSLFSNYHTRAITRMLGWLFPARTICYTVEFVIDELSTIWEVILWSSDERSGVEFYRVTPIIRPANSESLPASPDAVISEA